MGAVRALLLSALALLSARPLAHASGAGAQALAPRAAGARTGAACGGLLALRGGSGGDDGYEAAASRARARRAPGDDRWARDGGNAAANHDSRRQRIGSDGAAGGGFVRRGGAGAGGEPGRRSDGASLSAGPAPARPDRGGEAAQDAVDGIDDAFDAEFRQRARAREPGAAAAAGRGPPRRGSPQGSSARPRAGRREHVPDDVAGGFAHGGQAAAGGSGGAGTGSAYQLDALRALLAAGKVDEVEQRLMAALRDAPSPDVSAFYASFLWHVRGDLEVTSHACPRTLLRADLTCRRCGGDGALRHAHPAAPMHTQTRTHAAARADAGSRCAFIGSRRDERGETRRRRCAARGPGQRCSRRAAGCFDHPRARAQVYQVRRRWRLPDV